MEIPTWSGPSIALPAPSDHHDDADNATRDIRVGVVTRLSPFDFRSLDDRGEEHSETARIIVSPSKNTSALPLSVHRTGAFTRGVFVYSYAWHVLVGIIE
jgi:hypothetical protein